VARSCPTGRWGPTSLRSRRRVHDPARSPRHYSRCPDRGCSWPRCDGLTAAAIALALVGLCVGSFLTAMADRAADGFAGLLTGRSRCPSCHRTLAPRDLVPVVSWLALRGRCRHCQTSIPASYPLVELAAGAVGVLAGALVTSPSAALVVAIVGWWLMALALIDLRLFRLPDILTLPLAAAGLFLAAVQWPPSLVLPEAHLALVGAAAGFLTLAAIRLVYGWLRGIEGLGLGDAKLAGAAGAWLGPAALPWLVLLGALAALAGAAMVYRTLRGDLAVPFGSAVALAFWGLLLGAQLGP
jgi:leader peptidase (prepilin peptidase)/N-methyltransferase